MLRVIKKIPNVIQQLQGKQHY